MTARAGAQMADALESNDVLLERLRVALEAAAAGVLPQPVALTGLDDQLEAHLCTLERCLTVARFSGCRPGFVDQVEILVDVFFRTRFVVGHLVSGDLPAAAACWGNMVGLIARFEELGAAA